MGIAADFVLIVLAGLIGALIARALRLPLLVGYVAAGVVIGPNTIGPTVSEVHNIELLAEIGVALLLFSLGLELSLRDLQPVRNVAIFGGSLKILLTGLLSGWLGVQFAGMSAIEATWFGSMIAVSSTMIVVKTLAERGVTATLASRVMIGMLVIEDLAVIPMLIILPQIGHLEAAIGKLATAIVAAIFTLAAVVFAGTRVLPRLLEKILAWGPRELFLVAVVATSVGVGFGLHLTGLPFALGAFIAGLILSESEISHQALSDLAPLKDIFGLLFFVSVGMLLDPRFAIRHALHIAVAVLLIFTCKGLVVGLITRGFGYYNMAPFIVGLGMAQVGEFSFVLARSGRSLGILSQDTYNMALTCTILTMGLSPLISNYALPLGRWVRSLRKTTGAAPGGSWSPTEAKAHVIIGGYGRTGKATAEVLRRAGIPLVIVELDHNLFRDAANSGLEAIWGDIASEEILHAAGIHHARLLILTTSEVPTVELTAARARRRNPHLTVIARAAHQHHIAELRAHGVDAVVFPEFEGGVEIVRQALDVCDRQDYDPATLIAEARTRYYGPVLPS